MDTVVEFVDSYLVPGSITFLMIGVTLGVLVLFTGERARVWARRWLVALVAGYWALSTPLVSGGLEAYLSRGYGSLSDTQEAQGATAIVVLTGGAATYRAKGQEISVVARSTALRALEGARVYRLLGDPLVFASGGRTESHAQMRPESEALRQALIEAGVPAERIVVESTSRNTREQALALAPMLQSHGIERFVLVTSPTHMRRAMATFRGAGMDPIASVSLQRSETEVGRSLSFLPDPRELDASRVAMREVIATIYYGVRGWLKSR